MLNKVDVDGVVMPATYPELIGQTRDILDDIYIISPGVGIQGAKIGDAISHGADYEIIGRKICDNENPKNSAEHCYNRVINI